MAEAKGKEIDIVHGLGWGCEFTRGEFCATKGANWDKDLGVEFELSFDDPRYQRSLALAHELKKQHPLEGLDPVKDRALLVARERAIVTALNKKIHEEYGDYNPAISKGEDSTTHPSMHGDHKRQDTNDPAKLSEFLKDELICRQYAPLMAALGTEAGMKLYTVTGHMNGFYEKNGSIESIKDAPAMQAPFSAPVRPIGKTNHGVSLHNPGGMQVMTPVFAAGTSAGDKVKIPGKDEEPVDIDPKDTASHLYVVSRLTGNIIEATAKKPEGAYKVNVSGTTIEDMLAGESVVTLHRGAITSYGTYRQATPQHDAAIAQRKKLIADGEYEKLTSLAFNNARILPTTDKDELKAQETAFKLGMKELNQSARRCDLNTARGVYEKKILPKLLEFDRAVAAEDLPKAKEIAQEIPVPPKQLARALKSTIKDKKSPEMAAYLLELGALEPQSKKDMSYAVLSMRNGKDVAYDKKLLTTLDLDRAIYLEVSVQNRDADAVMHALETIKHTDITAALETKMRVAIAREKASGPIQPYITKMEAYLNGEALAPEKKATPETVTPPPPPTPDPLKDNMGLGIGGIVGAVVGWLVGGGPIGAVIGALLAGAIGAVVVDKEKGVFGNYLPNSTPQAPSKLEKAVNEYAALRCTDLQTGTVNTEKAKALSERYLRSVAGRMDGPQQEARAAEIAARTTEIRQKLKEAAQAQPGQFDAAMKQALEAFERGDKGLGQAPSEVALPLPANAPYSKQGVITITQGGR